MSGTVYPVKTMKKEDFVWVYEIPEIGAEISKEMLLIYFEASC